MVHSHDQRNPVELLCEQFLEQWRRGEPTSIEEFADRYTDSREEILALFPMMLAMESVKESHLRQSSARPVQLKVDRLEQLGDYRIIREIGRGGMAIVFEAEQQSLRRRVALKVFPAQAFEDSDHLKRFEREAKTVAGLHHHNIVPVFGTGEQDKLHYFVMQLINGMTLRDFTRGLQEGKPSDPVSFEPLREIFDDSAVLRGVVRSGISKRNGQSLQRGRAYWQRVADIGVQVADALSYAHQKGVLHRDIKPSNLILDAEWRVWVTDFGLAVESSHDPLSRTGDVVGTLPYMAPERLNGKTDARSDIYSLGLTLYELLTYRSAIDALGRADIRRKVLEGDVPSPRSICKDIPEDLETIVLKAMAKEPRARYQSAEELRSDLANFRNDRPILARRAGPIDRMRRWSRRNPTAALSCVALMLCISVSLAMVTSHWRRAVHEAARAETNLTLALNSMDRLLGKFESDWMEHPVAVGSDQEAGPTELRFVVSEQSAAVLTEALTFYEEFAEQNASNPRLKLDTATAYKRVGGIYERLGKFTSAEAAYRSELATLIPITDSLGEQERVARLAESYNRLAMVLNAQYDRRAAKGQLTRASTILSSGLLENEEHAQLRYLLAVTNNNLGKVLWWMHDFRNSRQKHRAATVLLEQLVEEHPDEAIYRLSLGRAYRDQRFSSFNRDREYASSLELAAVGLIEGLVADYPDVPDYRCELSELLLAGVRFGSGQHTEKWTRANRGLELAEQLVDEYPEIPRYRAALANALTLSTKRLESSEPEEAMERHGRAVAIYSDLCEQFPNVNHYLSFTAQALSAQAKFHLALGDRDVAAHALRDAIDKQRTYLANRPESGFARKWLVGYLHDLARIEDLNGNRDAAEKLRADARMTFKKSQRSRGS